MGPTMTPAELFDLKGKRVLITGGGTGLGRQFATALADAGAEIILAARRAEPLEDTAAAIRGSGGAARCVALDITNADHVTSAFAEHIGDIDVLVNNAGTAGPGSLLDMSEDTWDRVLDVNLKGAWLVSRAAAQQMIARKSGGSIINVASVLGMAVQKWTANYPASKAALLHLTRAMAHEWARYGIRVNALAPGYFQTEMSVKFLESEHGQGMLKRMPIRRLGNPQELCGALLLLASDASTYMTGSTITVDGGLSLPVV
jgi:NAD(P)-dependent dehydrogenase (short-subunit alcohol dehydrogenase family)